MEPMPSPTASTTDIDASAWLFSRGVPLLQHKNEGRRTRFVFAARPEQLSAFYGPEGKPVREALAARRALLALVHGEGL